MVCCIWVLNSATFVIRLAKYTYSPPLGVFHLRIMHRGHEACWFIVQIEYMWEFSIHSVAHFISLHIYLYWIYTRVQFRYCSCIIIIWYWYDCKTPLAYWLVACQLNLILLLINFGDSMNFLHQFSLYDWFLTITGFNNPLIYYGLLSIFIVSLVLN